MNNGPNLWAKILEQMPAGAIVAGGCVRDWYLDVPPKDIDVFVGPTYVGEARSGLYRIDNWYERQEEYLALTNIQLVSTGKLFGYRVDLVELTQWPSNEAVIHDFDFGLNQMWFDGDMVYQTTAAARDLNDKTITLLTEDRLERSLKRFDRFNQRMGGGWSLVRA